MLTKFERVSDLGERKRLHCNECGRTTIHALEAQTKGRWDDANDDFSTGREDSIYRCGACDEICFQSSVWSSEWLEHDENGDLYMPFEVKQYPVATNKDFTFDFEHTPHRLDELITELLSAYGSALMISTTIMLRLVIEFIANDIKCVGRTLKAKIDNMQQNLIIDADQARLFQKIREHGNAGAHGAIAMSNKQVLAAMSVISLLIEKHYNAPGRQNAIMKRAEADLA